MYKTVIWQLQHDLILVWAKLMCIMHACDIDTHGILTRISPV